MRRVNAALVLLPLILAGSAAPAAPEAPMETHADVDAAVRALYHAVTFEAGHDPDWDAVRNMFLEEAVIVLRTGREATTVFSVDGFIDDFIAFAERVHRAGSGFSETIVRSRTLRFGAIAHVLVLYEAHVTGGERPPQRGVDSIELVLRDGVWRIAAITNELPDADRPLPEALRDPGEG